MLKWWKSELAERRKRLPSLETGEEGSSTSPSLGQDEYTPRAIGSLITLAGPLLSYPTLENKCPTPLLVVHRPSPSASVLPSDAITSFKKGYDHVQSVSIGKGEGMPRSREEMEPLMRFWSEHLGRRQAEGLYEVMSGGPV